MYVQRSESRSDAARHRMRRVGRCALLTALIGAASAVARTAGAQLPPYTPPPSPDSPVLVAQPVRAVSASPIILIFGSLAGDYEQRWTTHTTWGAGAQYDTKNSLFFSGSSGYDFDLSLKARYYPSSPALDGYSLGLVGGFTTYQRPGTSASPNPDDRSHTIPTLGFTLDYNRLLGDQKHLLVGTGFGFKRRFIGHTTDVVDQISAVRPTIRLVIGYAW